MRRVGDNPVASTSVENVMRMAIEATRSTYPHPNPRVGAALISPDGDVLSVAAHQAAGEPHAEILALDMASSTVGTTLVSTLEPCNHHARTGPCTEAIIEGGIQRVVIGAVDPDIHVSGTGIARLRAAGIEVEVGVLNNEVVANDPGYFHHRTTGTPRVTLKLAATLDGQAAAADGTSRWITSEDARTDVHRLRSENDVIIVGAGTVVADNPALTVRLEDYAGPQPRPVVITGTRPLPKDREVMQRDPIVFAASGGDLVDPVDVIRNLGERGFVSAMIEGGPSIATSFLDAGVVDEIVWYVGAKLAGGSGIPALTGTFGTMADITDLTFQSVQQVGPDVRISATLTRAG